MNSKLSTTRNPLPYAPTGLARTTRMNLGRALQPSSYMMRRTPGLSAFAQPTQTKEDLMDIISNVIDIVNDSKDEDTSSSNRRASGTATRRRRFNTNDESARPDKKKARE